MILLDLDTFLLWAISVIIGICVHVQNLSMNNLLGNFGEILNLAILANLAYIAKLKTCQLNLMHTCLCMAVRLQIANNLH